MNKDMERRALNADLEQYLAAGGIIEILSPGAGRLEFMDDDDSDAVVSQQVGS